MRVVLCVTVFTVFLAFAAASPIVVVDDDGNTDPREALVSSNDETYPPLPEFHARPMRWMRVRRGGSDALNPFEMLRDMIRVPFNPRVSEVRMPTLGSISAPAILYGQHPAQDEEHEQQQPEQETQEGELPANIADELAAALRAREAEGEARAANVVGGSNDNRVVESQVMNTLQDEMQQLLQNMAHKMGCQEKGAPDFSNLDIQKTEYPNAYEFAFMLPDGVELNTVHFIFDGRHVTMNAAVQTCVESPPVTVDERIPDADGHVKEVEETVINARAAREMVSRSIAIPEDVDTSVPLRPMLDAGHIVRLFVARKHPDNLDEGQAEAAAAEAAETSAEESSSEGAAEQSQGGSAEERLPLQFTSCGDGESGELCYTDDLAAAMKKEVAALEASLGYADSESSGDSTAASGDASDDTPALLRQMTMLPGLHLENLHLAVDGGSESGDEHLTSDAEAALKERLVHELFPGTDASSASDSASGSEEIPPPPQQTSDQQSPPPFPDARLDAAPTEDDEHKPDPRGVDAENVAVPESRLNTDASDAEKYYTSDEVEVLDGAHQLASNAASGATEDSVAPEENQAKSEASGSEAASASASSESS